MNKSFKEVTADGKTEIVPGKEPLKKEPNSLRRRWKKLKKAIKHDAAILNLRDAEKSDDNKSKKDKSPSDVRAQMAAAVEPQQDVEDQQLQPEDMEMADVPQQAQPEEAQINQRADQDSLQDLDPETSEEELIQALRDSGYSDPEIAFIVHNHHPPAIDDAKHAKAKTETAMSQVDVETAQKMAELEQEVARRKADHEHSHAAKMSDHELEHKKRMLDLEYESAKSEIADPAVSKEIKRMELEDRKLELDAKRKELELELEFRKKEHELKLRHMENRLRRNASVKRDTTEEKHKQKLKQLKLGSLAGDKRRE
jgi:hypothetical protein